MTELEIRFLAERALSSIKAVPAGHVFASRKGVMAATDLMGKFHYAFRRGPSGIRFEMWPCNSGCANVTYYDLPTDLANQASITLDSL